MDTPLFAVVGNPVEHSLSPQIHSQFAEQTGIFMRYEKILAPFSSFEAVVLDFFQQGGQGLNVTLPFKERAFAMADVVSMRAKRACAANVLWMQDKTLHADNTDGIGLITDLRRYTALLNKTIVVLGAGGAARGIIGSLLEASPASLTLSNRSIEKAEALKASFPAMVVCPLEALTDTYDILINATSASLTHQCPILPKTIFTNSPFCYDLAYSLEDETPFVALAKEEGARAKDGIGMLIEQAAESFYIWHGIRPDTALVDLSVI